MVVTIFLDQSFENIIHKGRFYFVLIIITLSMKREFSILVSLILTITFSLPR